MRGGRAVERQLQVFGEPRVGQEPCHDAGGGIAHAQDGRDRCNPGALGPRHGDCRREVGGRHRHAPADTGACLRQVQDVVALVDDQELEVTPERRFGGGRVGHVRLQPVAQDAEDGGEAGLVAHHLAHGLVDTLARALHFLEQSAAAVERGALVAQLRQPPGQAGVAVAQGGGVGDVHMHLALEADGLVDTHHVLDHVVVACGPMAIEFHAERLVPALDACELLFQATLSLVDRRQMRRGAGDVAVGVGDLLAQAVGGQPGLLRGLRGAGAGIRGRHDGALGLVGCFGGSGHALGGVVDLGGQFLDARIELREPGCIGGGLFANLGERTLGHLGALHGLLLAADRLDAALLQDTLGLLGGLPRGLGRVAALLEHGQRAGKRLAIRFERSELAGEARQLLAIVVVQVKRHALAQCAPASVERLESPGLLGLALDDAQPTLGACQLLAHQDQVLLRVLELALRLHLAGAELGDAGRLFQDGATLHRRRAQHGVDLSLLDDGVGIVADARVHEQFLDVAQAHLAAVDQVFAATVGVEAAGDLHLVGVDGEPAVAHGMAVDGGTGIGAFLIDMLGGRVHLGLEDRRGGGEAGLLGSAQRGVVEDERDARHAARLARGAAGEDDVEHGTAAQALRAALAEHPLDGVHHVRLAAAVGADHADDRLVEPEFGGVGKALEAAQDESGKAQG